LEIKNPENKSFLDVLSALYKNYGVETRVAGNTISYRHPEYKDKNGNLVSVRASKLGDQYTRKGITYELNESSDRKNCQTRTKYNESNTSYWQNNNGADESSTRGTQRTRNNAATRDRSNRNIHPSTNFEHTTRGQRTSCYESTISSLTGTSRPLQETLSEIRGYDNRFNPEQSEPEQYRPECSGREDKHITKYQPVASKTDRNRYKPHRR
jgi:predicted adenine nucleotide alpha hydrolase (AANH) superfamily ATPase